MVDDNRNIRDRFANKRVSTRIALIYLAVAAAWIFGSDALLQAVFSHTTAAQITKYQTAKGVAFVTCTAGLLYLLIRRAVQELHEVQAALAQSEQRLKWIVEWLPTGISLQVRGQITYMNRAMLELLGEEQACALLGRDILEKVHPDDRPAAAERNHLLSDQRQPVPVIEQRLLRRDGSYVSVETAARPFDLEGQQGALVIAQDISKRKQALDALKELNQTLETRVAQRTAQLQTANDDLRTFSLMISHDLQTPLRRISQFAQEVLGNVGVDEGIGDRARRIVAAAARLERMVEELHAYNQVVHYSAATQPLSPVLVAHDVVGQLRGEPGFAEATINVREPMPHVLAHRPTLVLVLQNLLSNAVRFVAPGVRPIVNISAQRSGDLVQLCVEDNGVGVRPENIDAIWHLMDSTTESGHRGFGLAIVRRGIERMGGRVWAESAPGVGSRFWVELRADPQAA